MEELMFFFWLSDKFCVISMYCIHMVALPGFNCEEQNKQQSIGLLC